MTLIALNPELGLFILRLAIAAVFLAHGPDKLMKSKQMAQGIGVSAGMIMMIGTMETLGALSMLLGLWTQVGAILLAAVMLGAIYTKTQKWGKKFTGEMGWELDFMVLASIITVFLAGSGIYSIG